MGVSVFQNSAFVWVYATLAGGCLAAVVAVGARAFWTELAARFLRMPAAGKAAFVIFVAVGAPMFAHRGVSRLWTAATTNGTVLLTWEKFFLGNNRPPAI